MTRYKSRILGELSATEKNWLDGLERSYLDLEEPFNATQAVKAIAATPTKKGTTRRIVPSNFKMAHVLKKSKDFEISFRDTKQRPYFVSIKKQV